MRNFLLALIFCLVGSAAQAQNTTCSDRTENDSSNACANTRFVQKNLSKISTSVFSYTSSPLTACTGTGDDSAMFTAALAINLHVDVPATNPSGTATQCVIGDIQIAQGEQRLTGYGAVLLPKAASTRVLALQGYNSGIAGFYITDNGNTVVKTTLATTASAGATSITVASTGSAPIITKGQRYSIKLDTGYYTTGFVQNVSGTTVTLSQAVPTQASAGANFYSTFGLINVYNSKYFNIQDVTCNNAWGCVLADNIGATDVATGTIKTLKITSARMFGLIKGRNVHDTTFLDIQAWGGTSVVANYTGNGATTTYATPETVFRNEYLTVKVNGATKVLTTDYTIAADGQSITFLSAPANGAAIVLNNYTYGHEGYVEDSTDNGTGIISVGGNHLIGSNFLQFNRCGHLLEAQFYDLTSSEFDTCGERALLVQSPTQVNKMNGVTVGWATGVSLMFTNAAPYPGFQNISNVTINPQPTGYSPSGATRTPLYMVGVNVNGDIKDSRAATQQFFSNGQIVYDVSASGNLNFGGCDIGAGGDILTVGCPVGVGLASSGVYLYGATSGKVKQAAQAVAGTPTITWGNSSGTPAVTASSPLSISTTTGNITAPGLAAIATSGSASDLSTGTAPCARLPALTNTSGAVTTAANGCAVTVTKELLGDTSASGPPAAGATVYLGPTGQGTGGNGWVEPYSSCTLTEFYVATLNAPGAGQTYTYTLMNSGSPVSGTGTISGASSYDTGAVTVSSAVSKFSNMNIKLVTSGGATVTHHRYYVKMSCT